MFFPYSVWFWQVLTTYYHDEKVKILKTKIVIFNKWHADHNQEINGIPVEIQFF